MKKEKFGIDEDARKHISAEEKKKNFVIYILVGILILIFVLVIIIMIPKKNTNEKAQDVGSKVDSKMIDSKNNNNTTNSDSRKDASKVSMTMDETSLTENGGVITIVDKNEVPYKWTAIYRIQKYVDGNWEYMELKNPENAIFPDLEYSNPTGTMDQSLVWVNKYGKLESGERYRIVKEAEGTEFFAEFVIR